MAVAIEFDKLTKEYDGVLAVDELSASIESGRITGFLGPNGAGKTTLLKAILGLAVTRERRVIPGQKATRDREQKAIRVRQAVLV